MAITANFSQADVKKRLDRVLEAIEEAAIEYLQKLAEECVTIARLIPPQVGFTDQTGNLRSSIGYMIFKDGTPIVSNYVQFKEGAEGLKNGKVLAEKKGAKYKQGLVLVVTAGMNYAIYLESDGRDVLTSAELFAKQQLPKLIAQLKSDIEQGTK